MKINVSKLYFARGLNVLCCPNWGLYVRGLFDLDSDLPMEIFVYAKLFIVQSHLALMNVIHANIPNDLTSSPRFSQNILILLCAIQTSEHCKVRIPVMILIGTKSVQPIYKTNIFPLGHTRPDRYWLYVRLFQLQSCPSQSCPPQPKTTLASIVTLSVSRATLQCPRWCGTSKGE